MSEIRRYTADGAELEEDRNGGWILYRDYLPALQKAREEARREALLEHLNIFDFIEAPCYLCSYNGEGYFDPEKHPCAKRFHERVKEGEAKTTEGKK